MTSPSLQSLYEQMDRPALIAAVRERDLTISAQRQELMEAMERIKEISRLLNLRNRKIFGSSSEKLDRIIAAEDIEFEDGKAPDQLAAEGSGAQSEDAKGDMETVYVLAEPATVGKPALKKKHPGRRPFPAHLNRVVEHFYPEGYDPSWNRELPSETTERLTLKIDLFVKVDVRHKFARNGSFAIAPYPLEDPFFKYKATTELACHMMSLRFGLHVPYCRFMQLLPGCDLSYSTLIGWAARIFEILAPLKPLLAREVLKDTKLLCMDETPFKLLDSPGKIQEFKAGLKARNEALKVTLPAEHETKGGKAMPVDVLEQMEQDKEMEAELAAGISKKKTVLTGQMWTLLNPTARLILFEFSPSRATINALLMLSGYKGLLMADAYTAYRRLARWRPGAIILLSCWAHARRKVHETQDPKYQDPVVGEILRRIGELYEIEREIKGLSPRKKKKVRKRSGKLLRSLKVYVESVIDQYTPKDAVRQALQYILNHWEALSAYHQHRHGIIDNNVTERAVRPITIARKNILFLGSVAHAPGAALMYSLIECCKMQKIDPQAWLLDVAKKIEYCHKEQLIDLLPHIWAKTHK